MNQFFFLFFLTTLLRHRFSQTPASGRKPQVCYKRNKEVHLQSDHGDQQEGEDSCEPARGTLNQNFNNRTMSIVTSLGNFLIICTPGSSKALTKDHEQGLKKQQEDVNSLSRQLDHVISFTKWATTSHSSTALLYCKRLVRVKRLTSSAFLQYWIVSNDEFPMFS